MKRVQPDYTNSILNVTNSILHYYTAPTHHPSHRALDAWLTTHQPNHIIYVLLDGCGLNVIRHHLPEDAPLRVHNLTDITSVFPPTTVAATTSVLTGLSPTESGHIGWVQYFAKEDTNLVVFLNQDYFTGVAQVENLKEKYLSHPTLYEQIRQANPTIQTNEFFPSFREGGSESFEQEVERVLMSTHNSDASFNYVYWVEPDLVEHKHGTTSTETKQVLNQLNDTFADLIAHITTDTAVILIADHGLVDVEQIPLHTYEDMMSLLRQQPSIEPRTTTFFVKDGQHELFVERFQSKFGDWFELYTKEAFLTSGLLGEGTTHPMMDQFLGDYISVATDKYMFGLQDGHGYKAHHAGLTEPEMMVPLVVYTKK